MSVKAKKTEVSTAAVTYVTLVRFFDAQDHDHEYQAGDVYPRFGYEPKKERIEELISTVNASGQAVIQRV